MAPFFRPDGALTLLTSSAIAVVVGLSPQCLAKDAASQPPKQSQTTAQQKINSHLLGAIDRARRGDRHTPDGILQIDAKGRALVEIRADVTDAIRKKLREIHATTVSALPEYRSILAWVPLTQLETLASADAVYGIEPAPQATTNKRRDGSQ